MKSKSKKKVEEILTTVLWESPWTISRKVFPPSLIRGWEATRPGLWNPVQVPPLTSSGASGRFFHHSEPQCPLLCYVSHRRTLPGGWCEDPRRRWKVSLPKSLTHHLAHPADLSYNHCLCLHCLHPHFRLLSMCSCRALRSTTSKGPFAGSLILPLLSPPSLPRGLLPVSSEGKRSCHLLSLALGVVSCFCVHILGWPAYPFLGLAIHDFQMLLSSFLNHLPYFNFPFSGKGMLFNESI